MNRIEASDKSASSHLSGSWAQVAGKNVLNSAPSIVADVDLSNIGNNSISADDNSSELKHVNTNPAQDKSISNFQSDETYLHWLNSVLRCSLAPMPSTTEMIENIPAKNRDILLTKNWCIPVKQETPWNIPSCFPSYDEDEGIRTANGRSIDSGTLIWKTTLRQKKEATIEGRSSALDVGNHSIRTSNSVLDDSSFIGTSVKPWENRPTTNIGTTWGKENDHASPLIGVPNNIHSIPNATRKNCLSRGAIEQNRSADMFKRVGSGGQSIYPSMDKIIGKEGSQKSDTDETLLITKPSVNWKSAKDSTSSSVNTGDATEKSNQICNGNALTLRKMSDENTALEGWTPARKPWAKSSLVDESVKESIAGWGSSNSEKPSSNNWTKNVSAVWNEGNISSDVSSFSATGLTVADKPDKNLFPSTWNKEIEVIGDGLKSPNVNSSNWLEPQNPGPLFERGCGRMITLNDAAKRKFGSGGFGPMANVKPITVEMIRASKQFRALCDQGFGQCDVEVALCMHQMRYEDALKELRNLHMSPINSSVNQPQRVRSMHNQTNEASQSGGSFFAGMYKQIMHAIQDGFLSPKILNQQLTSKNMKTINLILQQVRQLRLIHNSGVRMDSLNVVAVRTQISFLQGQLRMQMMNRTDDDGEGELISFDPPRSFNQHSDSFDFSNASETDFSEHQARNMHQSRLHTWKSSSVDSSDSFGDLNSLKYCSGGSFSEGGHWNTNMSSNTPDMTVWRGRDSGIDSFDSYDHISANMSRPEMLDEESLNFNSHLMYSNNNGMGNNNNAMMNPSYCGGNSTCSFSDNVAGRDLIETSDNAGNFGWNNSSSDALQGDGTATMLNSGINSLESRSSLDFLKCDFQSTDSNSPGSIWSSDSTLFRKDLV